MRSGELPSYFAFASVVASFMETACLRLGYEAMDLSSAQTTVATTHTGGFSNGRTSGTATGGIAESGGTRAMTGSPIATGGTAGTAFGGTSHGGTSSVTGTGGIAAALGGASTVNDTGGAASTVAAIGGTTTGNSNNGGTAGSMGSTATHLSGGTGGGSPAVGGANSGGTTTAAGTTGTGIATGASCSGALSCNQADCCATSLVPAGTYNRGSSPAYSATVNQFYLDKFEVTVGRFRAFVAAYDAWRAAAHPSAGEGMHENPSITGSGWDTQWDTNLPASAAVFADSSHLTSCGARGTWSNTPGTGVPNPENYPINCVSWYEAFAFCVWDGGRLPTEAEWQYAAGGGTEYRIYPWGNTPNTDPLPANYYDNHRTPFLEVGSESAGDGRWGQCDLAGSMTEWIFDWWATDYASTCDNCANLNPSSYRCTRGGTFLNTAVSLEVGSRGYASPESRLSFGGLRCARGVK